MHAPVTITGQSEASRPRLSDFSEFLEEVVLNLVRSESSDSATAPDHYGKAIPLTAIPYLEMTVVYPVAQISALLKQAEKQNNRLLTFLDVNSSLIVKLLRTRLW